MSARSLAPGDVVRSWPLWLQWLTVVGALGSPTGLISYQRSEERAQLAELRADLRQLREAVSRDHDTGVESRAQLSRIERDLQRLGGELGRRTVSGALPPPWASPDGAIRQ